MRLLEPADFVGDDDLDSDQLLVATRRAELRAMAAALNEALELVDEWEFHTRLGMSVDAVRLLRSSVAEVLSDASEPG